MIWRRLDTALEVYFGSKFHIDNERISTWVRMTRSLRIWPRVRQSHQGSSCVSPVPLEDLEVSSVCFSSLSLSLSLSHTHTHVSLYFIYSPIIHSLLLSLHIFWPCRFINLTLKTLEIRCHFKSSSPYQLVPCWSAIPTRGMYWSR